MRWHLVVLTAAGMLAGAPAEPMARRLEVARLRAHFGWVDAELLHVVSPHLTSSQPVTVREIVARYDSAWNQRDTSTVSGLLAPQYQYFTSLGGVSSRAETLAMLSAPDYRLEHAKRSEIAVTMIAPVAIVSSRWQGRGTYRGKPFRDDQRCGQTWLQTDRTWLLLSEHCVQITPARPSE